MRSRLKYADQLPAVAVPEFLTSLVGAIDPAHQHEAWRYTLMSGLIPALPLILIRPFLPESPVWAAKKAAGTLKRPSILELFAPRFRRTTIVTTLMFACSYGVAFGAIQQMTQIVPGAPEVKAAGRRQAGPGAKEDRPAIRRHGRDDSRDRRTGRPGAAGLSGGPHRQPAEAAAHVPVARPDHRSADVRPVCHRQPDC